MNELRLPFVLWLPGEAAPDLFSMSTPVRMSIWLLLDHQLPGRAVSSNPPKVEDDANV
jgi:hypothetical protein